MKKVFLYIGVLCLFCFTNCEKEEDLSSKQTIETPQFNEAVLPETSDFGGDTEKPSSLKAFENKIIEIAEHEHGRGPNDVGKDLNYYPYKLNNYVPQGDAWCSEFVSWVYKAAGWPLTGGSYGGWMVNTHTKLRDWFNSSSNSRGEWYQKGGYGWNSLNPKPGDYIRFVWASNGNGHSGIVRGVSGTTLYTVEGNYGNKVVYRTIYNWRTHQDVSGIGVRTEVVSDFNGKIVSLTNKYSGKCLDVNANSSYVYQNPWNGNSDKKWKIESVGSGYYKLTNQYNNNTLDVNNGSSYARNYTYNGSTEKHWRFISVGGGYYKLINRYSNQALDVNDSDSDSQVRVYSDNGNTDKHWYIKVL